MKEEVSAGIILFNEMDTRKFLLLNYPSKHWDFVKGKMEKGETPHETAIRETKEETGLPGSPNMGVSPIRPKARGFPGFMATFQKSISCPIFFRLALTRS